MFIKRPTSPPADATTPTSNRTHDYRTDLGENKKRHSLSCCTHGWGERDGRIWQHVINVDGPLSRRNAAIKASTLISSVLEFVGITGLLLLAARYITKMEKVDYPPEELTKRNDDQKLENANSSALPTIFSRFHYSYTI